MDCERNVNFINSEVANEFPVPKNFIFFHSQTFAFHNVFSSSTFAPFFLCASSTTLMKSSNIDIYRVSVVGTHVHVHAFSVLC